MIESWSATHALCLEDRRESVGVVLRGKSPEIEVGGVEAWLLQPQPECLEQTVCVWVGVFVWG